MTTICTQTRRMTNCTQTQRTTNCTQTQRMTTNCTQTRRTTNRSQTQRMTTNCTQTAAPAAAAAGVIGGSEADLKLHSSGGSGPAERRQSGWARLRRWRSHRDRTTLSSSRSPYCTPPEHWSPVAGPSLRPLADRVSESQSVVDPPAPAAAAAASNSTSQPAAAGTSTQVTGEIHRPSLRNTCGQYVREQLLSFSQPSDNRLSMKLFGSKNAFVREKLRRTAAASSQTGSSWLIHPCSNFR